MRSGTSCTHACSTAARTSVDVNRAGTPIKARGGAVLEGYPIDTPRERYPAAYAWTGFVQTFRNAGFEEVARRSETRPIMRKVLA